MLLGSETVPVRVFHVPFQHWFGVCAASHESWHSCLCARQCIAEILIFYLSCCPISFSHLPLFALVTHPHSTHHSLLSPSQMCPLRTVFIAFPWFRWKPWVTKWQFLCFLSMLTLRTHQDSCLWAAFFQINVSSWLQWVKSSLWWVGKASRAKQLCLYPASLYAWSWKEWCSQPAWRQEAFSS